MLQHKRWISSTANSFVKMSFFCLWCREAGRFDIKVPSFYLLHFFVPYSPRSVHRRAWRHLRSTRAHSRNSTYCSLALRLCAAPYKFLERVSQYYGSDSLGPLRAPTIAAGLSSISITALLARDIRAERKTKYAILACTRRYTSYNTHI